MATGAERLGTILDWQALLRLFLRLACVHDRFQGVKRDHELGFQTSRQRMHGKTERRHLSLLETQRAGREAQRQAAEAAREAKAAVEQAWLDTKQALEKVAMMLLAGDLERLHAAVN